MTPSNVSPRGPQRPQTRRFHPLRSKPPRTPDYLLSTEYGYYFRFCVPSDLQALVGRRELRYTLRTGRMKEARERAQFIGLRIKKLFQAIRQKGYKMTSLDSVKIKTLVRKYVKQSLQEFEDDFLSHLEDPTWQDLDAHQVAVHDMVEEAHTDLIYRNCKSVYTTADRLLSENGIKGIDKDGIDYRRLAMELLKARFEVSKEMNNRAGGEYPPSYVGLVDGTGQPSEAKETKIQEPEEETSPPLVELVDGFSQENIRAENWAARTIGEAERGLKVFVKFMQEKAGKSSVEVHKLKASMFREYKETLLKLPKAFTNRKDCRDLSFEEMAAKQWDSTLSPRTINDKYLSYAKGVMKWGLQNGYIEVNPAQGIAVRKTGKGADTEVLPFSKDDLKLLFEQSPAYRLNKHRKPHQFWLPVLGLYTGCRIEELCQLQGQDLVQSDEQGLWVIQVTDEGKGGTASIKTKASRRLVPLHPVLVSDLNFPDFVKRSVRGPEDRIFSELEAYNHRHSHHPSMWFTKYRKACGVEAPPRVKTFHSFRHTVANHLKQEGVHTDYTAELLGHTIKGMSYGTYAQKYKPEILYREAVLKLDYGLDLKHLKRSRFVRS